MHLNDAQLRALLDGELAPAEEAELRQHLSDVLSLSGAAWPRLSSGPISWPVTWHMLTRAGPVPALRRGFGAD